MRFFVAKDFNVDCTDINLPEEDDILFLPKAGICSVMGIPCENTPSCKQKGNVDCNMMNLPFETDPLSILIEKEESGRFIALDLDSEPDSQFGSNIFEVKRIESEIYMEDVFQNLEDIYIPKDKDILETVDVRIFDIMPKHLSIRRSNR